LTCHPVSGGTTAATTTRPTASPSPTQGAVPRRVALGLARAPVLAMLVEPRCRTGSRGREQGDVTGS
jgi:hypothetical protein